jgi:hypothetical protein
MSTLYTLHHRPAVERPTLVICLEGWIDAAQAAAMAAATIRPDDNEPIADFDGDSLIDYRARRPVLHLIDGLNSGLTWPTLQLRSAVDIRGQEFLLLTGPEPDFRWHHFVREVVELATDLDVKLVVGFGAYPVAAPHTRAARLSATATTEALAAQVGFVNATLDIPAGVQGAIERECMGAGIDAIGLWAQVPHYATQMPYPGASVALLEGLRVVAGIEVDMTTLLHQSALTRSRLDELVAENPEHEQMVRQLEHATDEFDRKQSESPDLPSGDELAAELEQFLRTQGDDGGSDT